jgi:uncharacterized protein YjbI with pentapeptide repeats
MWAENHHSIFVEEPAQPVSANPVNSVSTEQESLQVTLPRHSEGSAVQQQVTGNTLPQKDASDSKKSFTPRNIWQQSEAPVNVTFDRSQHEQLKSNVFDWNKMRKQNKDISVQLNGAPFDHKNLSYANLSHASLFNASFKATDLGNSDLRFADLRGCNFREANLQQANLEGADLRGANLWRANLSRSRLNNAVVSSSTILDSGKIASAELAARHGLIFVEQ